jgi:hypothetical protein
MLPAPPPRQPLQKRPAVQGDMGVLPRHGACAHESMSPQAGISPASFYTRGASAYDASAQQPQALAPGLLAGQLLLSRVATARRDPRQLAFHSPPIEAKVAVTKSSSAKAGPSSNDVTGVTRTYSGGTFWLCDLPMTYPGGF